MRKLLHALILLLGFIPALAHATTAAGKVLLVVSSHGREAGKTQPGFEMDELSQAWLIFRTNGITADIASPAGGAVVADEYDLKKPYNAAMLSDPVAQAALANTHRLDPAMRDRYDAIFVIGGKGAMFDLPFSQVLQQLILDMDQRGAVIGAVCHGPAVLARIRTAEGKSFAAGRKLTGFADEEEAMFGKRWVPHFPFLLETELRRLGANFSEAPIMLPHLVEGGRVITGQNPYSVALAAEAIVRALGRKPIARQAWADERSMTLIGLAAAGNPAPLTSALKTDRARLDVPLIAIWGYYRSQEARGDRIALARAITVMELAQPWFPEPQLVTAIAEARKALEKL